MSCFTIFQTRLDLGPWEFLKSVLNPGAYLGPCQTSTETATRGIL